jgi:Holliday junction resolvase RusA-like endonuclease
MVQFTVPGLPVALKRPRMTKRGIVYDPSKKEKQMFAIKCNQYRPQKPWKGPIGIDINFLFKRPVSHIKKNNELRKNAPGSHIYKPDIDNLVKFVLDSLSGTFFDDDRQVVRMNTTKAYNLIKDSTVIKIYKLD